MTDSPTDAPELSVVVTIVDGGAALERCLDALAGQTGPPSMEVLVPYDQASRDAADLAGRYPAFTFVDLGEILGGLQPRNALEQHAFYDARRAGALRIARGRLLAILEDRGAPAPDWAARMVALHKDAEIDVIGGAIEPGSDRIWDRAVFLCDFGRFQPPLAADAPEYVSDTNVCYKRAALESVRPLWQDRYEEAAVNWALRRNGAKMRLDDGPRTVQRRAPMGAWRMAMERFHWGRVFGRMRGREIPTARRLMLAAAMPMLPLVLLVRHFRGQRARGHGMGRFVPAVPALLYLLIFWATGEGVGYLESGSGSPPGAGGGRSA